MSKQVAKKKGLEHKHLIQANELSKDQKTSFKLRVIYGAIMACVAVPCIVFGGYAYLVLVGLVIACSTYEIAKAPSHKLSILVWAVTFIVMYALIFWVPIKSFVADGIKEFDVNTSFTGLAIQPIAIATMIFVFFFVVVIKPQFSLIDACYLIAMTLLLALGFQAILCVRYLPFKQFAQVNATMYNVDVAATSFKYGQSMFFVLYLLIAVCFNDIGAYIIGVCFGKHKMIPRISPKKTWEGFVGGIIISTGLSFLFAYLVAKCGYPMLPNFDTDKFYWILLVSFLLPFAGNLGDFTFSAIKRHFGIKDYSHVLGPHGGILDRIDSIIFGALAVVILVAFITNNWDFFKW